jgi:hypothetical protein
MWGGRESNLRQSGSLEWFISPCQASEQDRGAGAVSYCSVAVIKTYASSAMGRMLIVSVARQFGRCLSRLGSRNVSGELFQLHHEAPDGHGDLCWRPFVG